MQPSRERYLLGLLVLAGLFVAALVACNMMATKFTKLNLGFYEFTISVGILPYPLTFLVTDILSELIGIDLQTLHRVLMAVLAVAEASIGGGQILRRPIGLPTIGAPIGEKP